MLFELAAPIGEAEVLVFSPHVLCEPDALAPSQPAFLPLRIWAPPRVGKAKRVLTLADQSHRSIAVTIWAPPGHVIEGPVGYIIELKKSGLAQVRTQYFLEIL